MEQLSIGGDGKAKRARKPSAPLATVDPFAQVVVDVPAAAVDRVFEYLVPEKISAAALAGVRVRVRFSGRLVDGFIMSREPTAAHQGKLAPLFKVSGVPVLTAAIAQLARAVADRYAGTLSEILRDAVPPRHAAAEKQFLAGSGLGECEPAPMRATAVSMSPDWEQYSDGPELGNRLEAGEQVRAALTVSPADDPTELITDLVGRVGGLAIVVVPDARDLERFLVALATRFGERVCELSAAIDPALRYGTFLKVKAGQYDIVVGTRNAVFAPVPNVRLLVLWDDGDDNLNEPRTPGWHAREVMALRSHLGDASLVLASHSRSVEVARLVTSGWLRSVSRTRALARVGVARVLTSADDLTSQSEYAGIRIPHFVWQVIHEAIRTGPVLVQVARSGYLTALACQQCRTPASCPHCSGPLNKEADQAQVTCRWCGGELPNWSCGECGASDFRAMSVGSQRTAAELARVFPQVPVRTSGRAGGVIDHIDRTPVIVVATVGAEPLAEGGYQGAVLLDGSTLLARSELRSEEQTVRRWFNVVALVRGAEAGGKVAVSADPAHRAVQALVRMDPIGWAVRELDDRIATGLPPTTRAASVVGTAGAVAAFASKAQLDPLWRQLGPVPVAATPGRKSPGSEPDSAVRLLVLAPLADGPNLAAAIKAALASTPDRGAATRVQVRMDQTTLV